MPSSDKKEAIHKKAYEIWEAEGRPEGKHEEHWSRAEEEMTEPKKAAAKQAPHAKKAEPAAEAPKPAAKPKAAPKAAAKPKAAPKG